MKRILKGIIVVYCHEFTNVIRDGGILLFLLFLPLVYPILYSLIYNPEIVRDVKMVIVDNDRSATSRQLARQLDATQEIAVIGYAANLNEGKRTMHEHECFGILVIPADFNRNIGRDEQAIAVLYSDMSLLLRYRAFLVAATDVAQQFGTDLQLQKSTELGITSSIFPTEDFLPITSVYMGNTKGGLDSFVMPGVLVLIIHQCLILAIGMVGGGHHERKRMGYLVTYPTNSVFISIIGRTLCYMTMILPATIFLVYYVPLIFSFPMAGNIFEILLFLMPMLLACIFFGFCFQLIVYERETVFMLWVATSIILLFLSGLTWPRYAMPQLWQVIGGIFPSTWGVEGFIKMSSNGASLWQVCDEYIMLWILTIGYFILACIVQRNLLKKQ